MGQTTARLKKGSNTFEILVDLDKALAFKKGDKSARDFLEIDRIFSDVKKGNASSVAELETAFNTTDPQTIAEHIVSKGEILEDQAHRDAEQEKCIKQVIDFLARNAVDPQSGKPHTAERLTRAIQDAHVLIKSGNIDAQIPVIVEKLSSVLPIKITKKKYSVRIPAMHTGRAYGLLTPYKSAEEWQGNGDLVMTIEIPAGMVLDFFDQLNSMTHGSAQADEIKE